MPKQIIKVAGIEIELTRKKMRSISIRINVPNGEVRASASFRYSDSQVFKFIEQKAEWIKEARARIIKLRDEGKIKLPPKLISGEEHYFFGKKFPLEVVKNSQINKITLSDLGFEMKVCGQSNFKQRQKLLDDFYRQHLKEKIPAFIAKYEEKMGIKIAEFGVKKMKTRWGTCNVRARRIWLTLELAKKPIEFLESIVVHEMTHLLEQKHSKRFYALIDQFMPEWRKIDSEVKGKIID